MDILIQDVHVSGTGLTEIASSAGNEVFSKQIEKRMRRISKQKKKIMQKFSSSRLVDEETMIMESPSTRIQLRQCGARIPRQVNQFLYFLFNGFIRIEINDLRTLYLIETCGIRIGSIERHNDYYISNPSDFEFTSQFDTAIYLLEASQDQQSYDIAQDLKEYKAITQEHKELINQIQVQFVDDIDGLREFESKRRAYRDKEVQKFLESHMSEDDFFFCCDGGINFSHGQIHPSKFRMSKNIFALIGIEEDSIAAYLVRKDTFSSMIPFHSRKRLTSVCLSMRVCSQSKKEWSVMLKDFEIRTLDNITIVCDAVATKFIVEFPQELQLSNSFAVLNDQELFQIVKFSITPHHLDIIMQQRGFMEKGVDHLLQNPGQDFEYALVSSIFIEKFYQKQMKTLDPSMYAYEQENEEEQKLMQLKKTCGFRYVSDN